MKNPELQVLHKDWEILLVLAEVGNLSRSADRLGIQQPTLSTTLKKVEEQLGFKVFIRTKTGLKITAPGKDIVNSIRDIKNFSAKAFQQVPQLSPDGDRLKGRMRIGMHKVLAEAFLAPVMQDVVKLHPGLDWEFEFFRSPEIARRVLNYECDLGIVVNPTPFPDLIIRNFGLDSVGLWADEKFAGALTDPSAPLLFNPEMIGAHKMLTRLAQQRLWIVPDYLEICRLLERLPAVGVLPSTLAKQFKNLTAAGAKILSVKIALVYRRERFETPLLKTFARDIFDCLQKIA